MEQDSRRELLRAVTPSLGEAIRTGRWTVGGSQPPGQPPTPPQLAPMTPALPLLGPAHAVPR